ncbi:MAG: hypothetical protein CMK07_01035 [Ponticaulis sp.]|nr:hypothetical protein [Ponticaulis sp.]
MDFLQDIFGGEIDLAALASGAGLFGGGASTILVAAFSGAIKRFLIRMVMTALLTGAGFLFLLDFLGFEIVPPEELRDQIPSLGQSLDSTPGINEQASRSAPTDEKVYVLKSPFRKDG